MANTLEVCLSYLPTGKCSDCDENRPDVQWTIDLPEEYHNDQGPANYVKDKWNELLDIADRLINDNYEEILKTSGRQEWFSVFFRPNRLSLSKVRFVYGLDMNDGKTRMCKKIHSGTNMLDRDIVEQLLAPIWVTIPEESPESNK